MKFNNDTLIFALGGLGEVGKNMYVVSHNSELIIVDAGVMFPESDLLGIDYVIPNIDYLKNNKDKSFEEIKENGIEKSQIKILALLTRLRQICCHPSLFISDYKYGSSKLEQCIEIIAYSWKV